MASTNKQYLHNFLFQEMNTTSLPKSKKLTAQQGDSNQNKKQKQKHTKKKRKRKTKEIDFPLAIMVYIYILSLSLSLSPKVTNQTKKRTSKQ